MEKLLYNIFLTNPNNLFDEFINECQRSYETPAHTFTEMRNRNNKKIRGDIFEDFCVLYLKYVKGYPNVWLLKNVPDNILTKLTLQRKDMGIDIIVETNENTYCAVQCKYKKHTSIKKNILSWTALSTFYALCLRTGPWDKYIIMTNCIYTRHQGKKTPKDLSICLKTLQNITKDEWLKMCSITGNILNQEASVNQEPSVNQETILNKETVLNPQINAKQKKNKSKTIIPDKEELRKLREKFYN